VELNFVVVISVDVKRLRTIHQNVELTFALIFCTSRQEPPDRYRRPARNKTAKTIQTMASTTNDGYASIEKVATKHGKSSKTILHPMKVDFPKRCITAILGPSGSGKSTLLSVVTDSIQSNVTATALVEHMTGHSSFVPQDDRLHGFFTCRSYMKHYTRLAGIAQQPGIDDKVETLLRQLGLSDCADTIVGDLFLKGLSGGQMRRLSVALEALTEPQVSCCCCCAETAWITVHFPCTHLCSRSVF